MKHSDFLKSLKTLKSQLKQNHTDPYLCDTHSDENVKHTYCSCKDSSGESKYLYTSQREIESILTSTEISLKIYPCPYEKGWHLTKN